MPFESLISLCFALGGAVLRPVDPDSQPPALVAVAERIQAQGAFHSEYRQERVVKGLRRPLLSNGVFHRDSSAAIRFEQISPFPRLLRISSLGIAERLPDGSEKTLAADQPFVRELTASLLALFAGDIRSAAGRFDAYWGEDGSGWILELKPKGLAATLIENVRVQGDSLVRRVEIREKQGNMTRLQFTPPIPDSSIPGAPASGHPH